MMVMAITATIMTKKNQALHFLNWMKQEPQSMVWLPVLHRYFQCHCQYININIAIGTLAKELCGKLFTQHISHNHEQGVVVLPNPIARLQGWLLNYVQHKCSGSLLLKVFICLCFLLFLLTQMPRFTAAESALHQAKCNICKQNPILGFRFSSSLSECSHRDRV